MDVKESESHARLCYYAFACMYVCVCVRVCVYVCIYVCVCVRMRAKTEERGNLQEKRRKRVRLIACGKTEWGGFYISRQPHCDRNRRRGGLSASAEASA